MANVINIGGGAGGGSNVVPNPQGTATDTLVKLGIEGTIYDFAGSGSGGAYIDTDTVIQAQTAIPANTDITYTATQDCVVVYYINIAANSMGVVSVDGVNVDGGWRTTLTGLRGFVFLTTGQTITLRQTYANENGFYTVYGVLGGSSGGGSSYSETELLSAPVQVGASSITLTDNISNYDLLVFEVGVFADNINQTFTSVALVSNIVNNPSDKTFIGGTVSANNNVYCVYFGIKYSSETQLTIIDSNRTGWSEAGKIISIKGIKYGSGSSSGHNYSTTEQVVGTWIDGSPIYEKTISTGAFSLDNTTTMRTILTDSNIGLMISAKGAVIEAGIIYSAPESGLSIKYNSPNLILEKTAGSWVVTEGYVTIRYTKTTT